MPVGHEVAVAAAVAAGAAAAAAAAAPAAAAASAWSPLLVSVALRASGAAHPPAEQTGKGNGVFSQSGFLFQTPLRSLHWVTRRPALKRTQELGWNSDSSRSLRGRSILASIHSLCRPTLVPCLQDFASEEESFGQSTDSSFSILGLQAVAFNGHACRSNSPTASSGSHPSQLCSAGRIHCTMTACSRLERACRIQLQSFLVHLVDMRSLRTSRHALDMPSIVLVSCLLNDADE